MQSCSSYHVYYVSDFLHKSQVLYRSKTVLTYYSDECQMQSFSSYDILLSFRFFSVFFSSKTKASVLVLWALFLIYQTLNYRGEWRVPIHVFLKSRLFLSVAIDIRPDYPLVMANLSKMLLEEHSLKILIRKLFWGLMNDTIHDDESP